MSVLVALTGSDSALVATDCRRIENDGVVRDDFPKTFRLHAASAVGGHTGLLEFSGRSVPLWLETLRLASLTTLDAVIKEAKLLFELKMNAISPEEVGFSQRRVDIVLIGRAELRERKSPIVIRTVMLRPDSTGNRVVGEIRGFTGYCATGDDDAMNAVLGQIPLLRPVPSALPRKRLGDAARNLIAIGARRAGRSPAFPSLCTCGGPPSVIFL